MEVKNQLDMDFQGFVMRLQEIANDYQTLDRKDVLMLKLFWNFVRSPDYDAFSWENAYKEGWVSKRDIKEIPELREVHEQLDIWDVD